MFSSKMIQAPLRWLELSLRRPGNKVLLLIDFDNVYYTLTKYCGAENIRLEERIIRLMEWVDKIGELFGTYVDEDGVKQKGHGFVFTPDHMTSSYKKMWAKHQGRLIICPKKPGVAGAKEVDTVDQSMIEFGRLLLRHPDVGYVCVVSGDAHFLPILQEAKQYKVKVALVAPTLASLSKEGGLIKFVDKNPNDGLMFLRLDTCLER